MGSANWKIEIEKEKIKKILEDIEQLNNKIRIKIDEDKNLEIIDQLVEDYSRLRNCYAILNSTFSKDYAEIINQSLKQEIHDLEESLSLLTTGDLVNYENGIAISLEIIEIKHKYFLELKPQILSRTRTLTMRERINMNGSPTFVPEINEIIDDLRTIWSNIYSYIRQLSVSDYIQLFKSYRILGDQFINIAATILLVPEDKIPNVANPALEEVIRDAYDSYEKASKYERLLEIPGSKFQHLSRTKYLTVFSNFFKGADTTNIRSRMHYLINQYPSFFTNRVKPYCWRSGGLCELKEDSIYKIEEGDGVFISMNYNTKSNFEFIKYIKKILEKNNLKLILKQERTRSRSWTKEICCTIYNNKYSLIILDKFSPNVVMELGIILGMGRKAIVLVNNNVSKGSIEDLLFSMINDYDCVVYGNVYDFYERFSQALNGIFFDNLDQSVPKIAELFNSEEIENLNKIIKEGYK